jgi:hypothetical protein
MLGDFSGEGSTEIISNGPCCFGFADHITPIASDFF